MAVGLLHGEGGAWVLVDSGFRNSGPRHTHAADLLAALRSAIPAGERLAAIACEPHNLLGQAA